MADLILLNGPPASGKSTLAQRFVADTSFALNLDIDVIRSLIGGWAEDPVRAGQVARSFALGMAAQHLTAQHHVVVPQFLGRPEFIDALAEVARSSGARFVEVGLELKRSDAIAAFAIRSAAPETQAHRDAAVLVDRSVRPDSVGAMFDAFTALMKNRPDAIPVEVVRGDIDATFRRFCEALR